MPEKKIRVLVVDDHPIVRRGLEAAISPEPDMEVIGAAATAADALDQFRLNKPDVTIMDLHLAAGGNGVDAIRAIRGEFPEARIIVLSAYTGDEEIYRALQAGAVTYLLKDTLGDDLMPIIRQVHAGGGPIPAEVGRKLADRITKPALTPREAEILDLVAKGLRNKEIAGKLYISEDTVQGHVKNILAKLKVHDRAEAVTVGIRRGILRMN